MPCNDCECEQLRKAVAAMEAKGKTYPPLYMAQRIDHLEGLLEWAATNLERMGHHNFAASLRDEDPNAAALPGKQS